MPRGLNDGAAALVLMSAKDAAARGLTPLARIASWAQAGVDPKVMGSGPIPASRAALEKAGWKAADLDLVEANEAFAAQACAVNKDMGWDTAKVNVNGGAIAIGHPIGASGARILTTLLYEMDKPRRQEGSRHACASAAAWASRSDGRALVDARRTQHRSLVETPRKWGLIAFQIGKAKGKHMARVAVVTGGTRGIGEAISVALKNAGYMVAANYAGNDERAKAFSERTGIAAYKWDVADPSTPAPRASSKVEAELGPVEVIVNNAGITRDATMKKMNRQAWDEVLDTNLGGCFNMCKAAWDGMLSRELRPHRQYRLDQRPGRPVWPGQLCRRQVRHPRLHQGAGARKAPPRASPSTPSRRAISTPTWWRRCRPKCWTRSWRAFPVGRLGKAAEIARGVLFLVADEGGFITGSTLSINGGQHMY